MIGIVIVSHSAKLAEGVCELAGQMAQGQVQLAAAGGLDEPPNSMGTDAFKVQQAIESVYSDDGVLVLMDLGSALLSAETALEFLDDGKRGNVRLCAAPLVEGAVTAVGQALAGADLDAIAREAEGALAGKLAQLQPTLRLRAAPSSTEREGPGMKGELLLTVPNRLGLHARPAVRFVQTVGRFDARVTVRNVTTQSSAVQATSINRVLSLGVRQGHQIAVSAKGAEASAALDALRSLVESGFGESDATPGTSSAASPEPVQPSTGEWIGIPASPGIAIGRLVQLRPATMRVSERRADDPHAEWQRVQSALSSAQDEVRALRELAAAQMGHDHAAIFEAHLLFLQDPALIESVLQYIHAQSLSAEFAWQSAIEDLAANLRGLDDAYLQARAVDVMDVGQRVLRKLTGTANASVELAQPAILAAYDVTPSDVKAFEPGKVLGLCLEAGSTNAHSVILARAMDIPVVVNLGPRLASLVDGTTVALDGQQGIVWDSPDAASLHELEERRQVWQAAQQSARASRHQLAMTRDGRRVHVLANINSVPEAARAVEMGAEGVGVLRTEFLFIDRKLPPTEEEQWAAYSAIADVLGSRPLVIRTLDVGGDKPLAYVDMGDESNPFLGWRGIRIGLGRPDLLKTQLKAILRASVGHLIQIMFPMVSTTDEVRAAKAIMREAQSELGQARIAFDDAVKVGIMIEVPAAAAMADQLAGEVSFFSIGSNDLSQYVMAADRTNARVASIADHYQPAVLRMIQQTVRAARQAGIKVGLCGELGGDPLAMPVLVGLGLDEFSMSAPAIPQIKQAIAALTLSEAEAVAADVLALDSGQAVRRYLAQRCSGM